LLLSHVYKKNNKYFSQTPRQRQAYSLRVGPLAASLFPASTFSSWLQIFSSLLPILAFLALKFLRKGVQTPDGIL